MRLGYQIMIVDSLAFMLNRNYLLKCYNALFESASEKYPVVTPFSLPTHRSTKINYNVASRQQAKLAQDNYKPLV